jgi:hypothetical protein
MADHKKQVKLYWCLGIGQLGDVVEGQDTELTTHG